MKILYFSLIDWDFIYQRPQHLAVRLSSKNDFTYVQPFGLRNLRFSDIHRVFRRLQSLFKRLGVNPVRNFSEALNPALRGGVPYGAEPGIILKSNPAAEQRSIISNGVKRGLHIKNFFFIPIIAPSITKINPFLLRYQINSHVDSETIIWVTYPSPLIPGILEGMKYGALVYEMMDDYPNVHPRSEEDIRRMEAWFVDKAALVITTSKALAEKVNRIKKGVRIRVIGNGVDYDFFNNASKVRPLEFKSLDKIIGYVGTISEWIDFNLVDYLADKRPDLNFVFIGPIRAKRLPLKKNIHFIGTIDYEKVPAYCNGIDVCLIPFQRGEFADAINPVKLYEYLALGKPVVSYYMRELERYKDVIYLAGDKEDFLTNVEIALDEKDNRIRELRRDIARRNDWTMISEVVSKELLKLVTP